MAVNIPGVISIVIFYLIILAVGVWAGRRTGKASSNEVFLAGRNMGLVVTLFTMTATMVGGGFINGTAEIIARSGLVWTQAPVGYCVGMFIGGMFFAPKMRRAGYVTMFDPFQEVYGVRVGGLMCLPHFMGDVFWTAAVLSALGSTISIIMDLNNTLSIVLSAVIAVGYTFLGGLRSVAYTDVIQLLCIGVGLSIACPFTVRNPAVELSSLGTDWLGTVRSKDIGVFIDYYGVVALGGIPWQAYFQRILACRSVSMARLSSCFAAVMCLMFAIPPALMGLAGAAADWNATGYPGEVPLSSESLSYILPLSLQYLSPTPVAIIGIGTLSAAVMSSADSSVLASATVFTNNLYRNAIRPQATDREMVWVLRIAILVAGVLATVMAISVSSVYGLYVMCSDLMYVILFPQFTCVIFLPSANAYGGLSGFLVSLVLRLLSGEPLIGLRPLLKFPFYNDVDGQLFPVRTVAMLSSFAAIILVSMLTNAAFRRHWVPNSWDILKRFTGEESRKTLHDDGGEGCNGAVEAEVELSHGSLLGKEAQLHDERHEMGEKTKLRGSE